MPNKNGPRLQLGNYPTPVFELSNMLKLNEMQKSDEAHQRLWIKRDDYSGLELSGNKTRKLEFALAEAQMQGATVVITAGAIQSNHCRQTATACRWLGLKPHLLLFGESGKGKGGNFLIDETLGAEITYVHPKDYPNYLEMMEHLKEQYQAQGIKAYCIPIGASYGIGNFGYIEGYREILEWQLSVGVALDSIVVAVGSGGTYAGLWLGHYLYSQQTEQAATRIVGISISSPSSVFKDKILAILTETAQYQEALRAILPDFNAEAMLKEAKTGIEIIDGFQGAGYAIPDPAAVERSQWLAENTGIILDSVYTGKAFNGLMHLLQTDQLGKDVLFVHTGGLFGFFGHQEG